MSFIKCILILVVLFANSATYSQQKSVLSGKITDTESSILPGATITIHNTRSITVSAADGTYKTGFVPAGKYLVEVSYSGYQSVVETIEISGVTIQDFVLEYSITEQQNVIVTGVSTAVRLRQSPQAVDLIRREALLQHGGTNIIEKLTQLPGVSALTTGPAIAKPFIRGLGYNRILTINDGVRQEGQQWGDEHGIEIDDYNVQKVEVLKGPASLMYGSDAMAGVINIQSLLPAPEGTVTGNVLAEYQTNNNLRGGYGSLAGTKNGFSFNLYGSYKGAADYRNKFDGYVFNSKFRNTSLGAMAGYSGVWGHSYLSVTNVGQQIGMVEGERDEDGQFIRPVAGGDEVVAVDRDFKTTQPFVPYQQVNHFKITSDNSFRVGVSDLDITVGWQQNRRKEFGDAGAPDEPEAFFDLGTLSYSAKIRLPKRTYWSTSFGVSGMQQTNKNKGEEAIIPDYALFDAGIFGFTQFHKNNITLIGGLRFDNRHVAAKEMMEDGELKFESFSRDFRNLSGSAGFSYEASEIVSLKLNLARGFRAPSLAELGSNGAHEGTNRYEIGQKDLKSENSFQTDAGLSLKTEHANIDAGIYYSNINNFIFYHRLVNTAGGDSVLVDPDSGDELNVFAFSQQRVHLYGAEIKLDIHPHPLDWLHFEHVFSVTRAQFTNAVDGSKNVPNIPAARYLAELRGNFMEKGKRVHNLYISLQSDYTFRQNNAFTGFNTETVTGSYWLLNAAAGIDLMNKNRRKMLSIHVTAQNLTDIAYQNHLSRLKYTAENNRTGRVGVFNIGRNFGVKVNVPVNFAWK